MLCDGLNEPPNIESRIVSNFDSAKLASKRKFAAELFFHVAMCTASFPYLYPMFYVLHPYIPTRRCSNQQHEVSALDPAPYEPTTCLLPAPGGQCHHCVYMLLGMPYQHRKH